MADFDEKLDALYQYFKEAMDRLEKLEEQEKEADKKSSPRLTLEMGGMRQLDPNQEYRNHLAYTKQRIEVDLADKLDHYYEEANLSPQDQQAAKQALQTRYQQEKSKTLDQSQDYLNPKLDRNEKGREETNRSLDQSQDYANVLLQQSKAQTKDAENPSPTMYGSGNYNYTMNLSFNKLEQNLEDKVAIEKEPEKEVERE